MKKILLVVLAALIVGFVFSHLPSAEALPSGITPAPTPTPTPNAVVVSP